MAVADLVAHLAGQGVTLTVQGSDLRVQTPPGFMNNELRETIRACKSELIQHLSNINSPCRLPVFIDLETRSAADLNKLGGRLYATHRTTSLLSVAALIDGIVAVWVPSLTSPLPTDAVWPSGPWQPLPVVAFLPMNHTLHQLTP